MTENGSTARRDEESRVEAAVSVILRTGVIISAAILFIGLGLLVARGEFAHGTRIDAKMAYPKDIPTLIAGLSVADPASIISLGLLVLIATPVTRVAASIILFAASRDWLYVVITAVVLSILVFGIAVGAVMG